MLNDSLLQTDATSAWDVITGNTSGITGWNDTTLNIDNFRKADGSYFGGRSELGLSTAGTVTITDIAYDLYWKGAVSGTWNKSDTAIFGKDSAEGTGTAFVNGDSVTFATSGAVVTIGEAVRAGTITISEDTTFKLSSTSTKLLSATGIEVASGKNLQLEGAVLGSIAGGINLVASDSVVTLKDSAPPNGNRFYGVGKVVLNQTNTSSAFGIAASVFTGDISLEKIGAGTVNLSVAQTYNGDTTVLEGALNASAALTTTGRLTVARDASMTLSAAGRFTQLSGEGTIDLGSAGTLTLSNSGDEKFSNWTGTIKVGAQTVTQDKSANWNCAGSTVEFAGSSGYLYGWNASEGREFAADVKLTKTMSGTTEVSAFNWNQGSSTSSTNTIVQTFSGKITGDGCFEKTTTFNQSFVFSGNLSEFTGTFKHSESGSFSTLTFGGKTDAVVGVSADVGSVTGTSTINWYQGTLTSSQDKRVYFNYSNDVRSDSRITGAILVKQGAGSLTLTQANSYSGGTTVEAGTLIAGNASALGTGAVTVNSGAKLQVKAGMNVSVSTADSTTVTLASGAKLVVDFADVALPAGAQEQTFQIMTAAVFSVYGTELSEGDVTSSMSGAWELLNGDDAWLDSAKWTLAGNTLSLTMTIPEPSVFGLLAGLGALALAGTRRRRRKA